MTIAGVAPAGFEGLDPAAPADAWITLASLARLEQSRLFGVTASDPVSFGAGAALLVVTMLGATLVPARRATRVSPLTALRVD